MDLKVAYFGIGCFWAESSMAKLKGVRKTRAGFAGGTVDNPTSRNCGDHSEVVEVRYNPAQCTYQDLLSWFLVHARSMWDHPIPAKVRRYRAVVLYADDEQEQLAAEATRKHKQQYGTDPVDVRAEKFVRFYPAVFYYQKYWLRCRPEVIGELKLSDHDIENSELAAKLNAFIAGYKDFEELERLQREHQMPEWIYKLVRDVAESGGDARTCSH